jgi:hypothetical protein
MGRQPDLKSQTKRIVFIPRTIEDEKTSEDFKKLCIQDGIQTYDLILEAIRLVFKVHHWPPGNPQLTLQACANGKPTVQLGKCGYANCKYKAVVGGALYLPNKKEYKLCEKHAKQAKADSKNWLIKKPVGSGANWERMDHV